MTQFLNGMVSKEWGDVMVTKYAGTSNLRRTESRRRFLTTMILGLWNVYDSLWKQWCETVHDVTDVHTLTSKEIDKRITFYFENKTKLFDSGDFVRFHMGLSHTLNMPILQRRAWLQTMAHRQVATDRARWRLVNKIRPITAYFDQVDTQLDDTVFERNGIKGMGWCDGN